MAESINCPGGLLLFWCRAGASVVFSPGLVLSENVPT